MTQKQAICFVALGSCGLLLGALGFQHLGGLAPCNLCLWQRWPHAIAIAIAIVALISTKHRMALSWLAALVLFVGASIALYHVGVEQGVWQGPTICSGVGEISDLSNADLLEHILSAPIIRCDDIVWQFLGLSMAGWNLLLSSVLGGLWLAIAWRWRVERH